MGHHYLVDESLDVFYAVVGGGVKLDDVHRAVFIELPA